MAALRQLCRRIGRCFGNMRLRGKLAVATVSIVMVATLLSMMVFRATSALYDALLYEKSLEMMTLSAAIIEREIEEVDNLLYGFVADKGIQENLSVLKKFPDGLSRAVRINYIANYMRGKYVSDRYIREATLFFAWEGESLHAGYNRYVIDGEERDALLERSREARGSPVYLPSRKEDGILYVARQVNEVQELSLQELGILVVAVDLHRIVRDKNPDSELLILQGGEALLGDRERLPEGVSPRGQGYEVIGGTDDIYFVAWYRSPYTGWLYCNLLSYQGVYRGAATAGMLFIVASLLILLGAVAGGTAIARTMSSPIEYLAGKMREEQVEGIDLSDGARFANRGDEIGDIYTSFCGLVDNTKRLIRENYTRRLLEQEAHYRSLQMQINPHFLYNTLDSINWFAKINRQQEISIMVEALGNLLRNSIDDGGLGPAVPLWREMELCRDYLSIQKIRYEERLEFALQEPGPDMADILIPKLTVQPLLENAIRYTVEDSEESCHLSVHMDLEGEELHIAVTDNGAGAPEDVLEQIRSGKIVPSGSGIGLDNIDQRLRLYYDGKSGLAFENVQGGFSVHIRVPVTRESGHV